MQDSNLSSQFPEPIIDLIDLYGAPSQAGFGSAVFYESTQPDADLDQIALRYYQYFVGDLWERFGEAAWMSAWKPLYTRPSDAKSGIVAELKAIAAPEIASIVPLFLHSEDSQEQTQKALSAAFDAPDITHLTIYAIGDGGAMSGVLVAGRSQTGDVTIVILLLD